MRHSRCSLIVAAVMAVGARALPAQQPFTLQQALSAPYATDLTPAPFVEGRPDLYAWVEQTEGRHNLWVGGVGEGAKPLPARQLTQYYEDDAQDIRDLAWSADQSLLAYTYGAEEGADHRPANPAHLQRPLPVTVIVQPLDPAREPLTLGEGRAPLFTPDCRHVLFVRGGQIWIADLPAAWACSRTESGTEKRAAAKAAPRPPHQLVFDRGAASQLCLSGTESSGYKLAFISTRKEANQPEHSYLALFDFATETLSFPAASTGNDLSPVFVDNGLYLAWLRAPFTQPREYANPRSSPNPWSIQLLQLRAAEGDTHSYPRDFTWPVRTLYTPPANQPGSLLPHRSTGRPQLFFPTPGTVVFSSEADGWNHLYALDWRSKRPPQLLTPGAFEVEDISIGHHASLLYYAANDTAPTQHGPLDADRRQVYRLSFMQVSAEPSRVSVPVTQGEAITTRPYEGAFGVVALASDAHVPMHPVVLDRTGAAQPLRPDWLPASYPAQAFVTPTQVLLPRKGAADLHAQLFLPPDTDAKSRHPALIFVHGGPMRQMLLGYPAMEYYSNAYAMNQYLAARGFVVLSVNYRCGVGYGLDFRACQDAGPNGGAEYNDVLAAAAYLRVRPDVDAKHLGIWGGSYGGYLTALALARNSDLFAAGVDFHGVHDWNLEDNAGDWKQGSFAQQDALATKARAASPVASVDKWRSPVLFIHGDNDPAVAYAQTPLLADALRARHVPVEELIFPDEVHDLLLHKSWLDAYTAAAAFFERTLKPQPAPSAEPAAAAKPAPARRGPAARAKR